MRLYKSDKKEYLYVMRVSHECHIYFGNPNILNMNMINDKRRGVYMPDKKDREEIQKEYLSCIDYEKLNHFKSEEALTYYLLYNKENLNKSISDFSLRFGVYVKNHHRQSFASFLRGQSGL